MKFVVLPRGTSIPNKGRNTAYLSIDHWNDYSFVTMFYLSLHDDNGVHHTIGNVKIGFKGQTTENPTYAQLGNEFSQLQDGYFSVGQDVDYYQKIATLPDDDRNQLLEAIKDIVFDSKLIELAQDEEVFRTSILRDVSLSVIKGQFSRAFAGQPPLTNFEFKFFRPATDRMSDIDLKFKVGIESKPSTNIHAIIGRNGVGKTTILNGMIEAIASKGQSAARFYDIEGWKEEDIAKDYFSSLVSVSFSAFDFFESPKNNQILQKARVISI